MNYPSERTPVKHRRSRSQRRGGEVYHSSSQKGSPSKQDYNSQAQQETQVHHFEDDNQGVEEPQRSGMIEAAEEKSKKKTKS